MAATTRCMWVQFKECGELPYGISLPMSLIETAYRCYVGPAIMCGNEAWCLK